MACMIQNPCSKHASLSSPPPAKLVYTCPLLFIRSALSLTTLIWGAGNRDFNTKCPNSFVQDYSFQQYHTNVYNSRTNRFSKGKTKKT